MAADFDNSLLPSLAARDRKDVENFALCNMTFVWSISQFSEKH